MKNPQILIQLLLIPLGFVAIGIFAKRLGRRDGDNSPHANDFAAATTVYLMTIGKIVADLSQMTGNREETFGWLIGVFIVAFFSMDHDRYRSWERDSRGRLVNKKRLWIGVILPTFFSFLIFFFYQLRGLYLAGAFN